MSHRFTLLFSILLTMIVTSCWDETVPVVTDTPIKLSLTVDSDSAGTKPVDTSYLAIGDTLSLYAHPIPAEATKEVTFSVTNAYGKIDTTSIREIPQTSKSALRKFKATTEGAFTIAFTAQPKAKPFEAKETSTLVLTGQKPTIPELLSKPQTVTATIGSPIQLSCKGALGTNVLFAWYKKGDTTVIGKDSSLSIMVPTLADDSIYFCVVSNKWGTILTGEITLKVTNNNAPVWNAKIPQFTTPEMQLFSINLNKYCSDLDLEKLTYAIVNKGLTKATLTDSVLSWTPTMADAGQFSIVVSASDAKVTVVDTLEIIVTNVNTKPVLPATLQDLYVLTTGEPFSLSWESTDLDEAPKSLTYLVDTLPVGAKLVGSTLTWTPATVSEVGEFPITLKATDGLDTVSKKVVLSIKASGQPPVITTDKATVSGGIVAATEGVVSTINVSAVAAIKGDIITLGTKTKLPEGASFVNGLFTWTPSFFTASLKDSVVTVPVTFTAHGTLTGAPTAEFTVNIAVANFNRAPLWVFNKDTLDIPAIKVGETVSYKYDNLASDLDTESLSYVLDNAPSILTNSNGTAKITAGVDTKSGTYTFRVTVSDGKAAVPAIFRFKVTEGNRAPAWKAEANSPIVVAEETQKITDLLTLVSDPDGEKVTISIAEKLPTWIVLDGANLSIKPTNSNQGVVKLTVTATDPLGEKAIQVITISVTDVNTKPVLPTTLQDVYTLTTGEPFSLSWESTDLDGAPKPLSYSVETAPAGAKIVGSTLTWTPEAVSEVGDFPITVKVTDGLDTTSKKIVLTVKPTTKLPVIATDKVPTSGAIVATTEGAISTINVSAVPAIKGDVLTLATKTKLPEGASFVNGVFVWKPSFETATPKDSLVTVPVTFTAHGTIAGTPTAEFTVNFIVANVNRAPKWLFNKDTLDLSAIKTGEAVSVKYDTLASDSDGQVLSYVLENAPEKLINANGTATFTAGIDTKTGTYTFKVTVSDGKVAVPAIFRFKVTQDNRAPVWKPEAAAPITISEGEQKSVDLLPFAEDADKDPLSLSISETLPSWISFTGTTLTLKPSVNDQGTVKLTVTASDNHGASAVQTITISVANVNTKPVLPNSVVDTFTVMTGEPLTISWASTDLDGTPAPLTYSADSVPAGAKVSGSTLTWTPTSITEIGSYRVTVKAFDGLDSATKKVTIVVKPTKQSPILTTDLASTSGTQLTCKEGVATTLKVTGTPAITGDKLTFAVKGALPDSATFVDGVFTWKPVHSIASQKTPIVSVPVTFTAKGSIAGTPVTEFTVNYQVNNDNRAPVITKAPANATVQMGKTVTATLDITDLDGDQITVTADAVNNSRISYNQVGKTITFSSELSPTKDEGLNKIQLTVSDGSSTVPMLWEVNTINWNTWTPLSGPTVDYDYIAAADSAKIYTLRKSNMATGGGTDFTVKSFNLNNNAISQAQTYTLQRYNKKWNGNAEGGDETMYMGSNDLIVNGDRVYISTGERGRMRGSYIECIGLNKETLFPISSFIDSNQNHTCEGKLTSSGSNGYMLVYDGTLGRTICKDGTILDGIKNNGAPLSLAISSADKNVHIFFDKGGDVVRKIGDAKHEIARTPSNEWPYGPPVSASFASDDGSSYYFARDNKLYRATNVKTSITVEEVYVSSFTGPQKVRDIIMLNSNTGWVITESGSIFGTKDGFKTKLADSGVSDIKAIITSADHKSAFAVTTTGAIYRW